MSRLIRTALAVTFAVAAIAASAAPAAAAPNGVLDPPAGPPGSAAAPESGWLAAVRPCTHWVDANTTGPGDAGPGSSTQPWRTIGRAMGVLQPGQTGCVRTGTYAEANLRFARSGTAAAPIALRAEGAVTVWPTAPATTASSFVLDSAAAEVGYWLVEGFTIDKQGQDGAGVYAVTSGSGRVRAVAVRSNLIKDGKGGAGIIVRGRITDAIIESNEVTGFARWTSRSSVSHVEQAGYGRADAHGLSIEGSGGSTASVERVLVRRNSFHDNGGDGVQCLTDTDSVGGAARAGDPKDIDLVDNRMVNTPGSAPVEENAVDLKSCQRVSIRGSDPPTGSGAAVQWNKFAEFLPTRKAVDASSGANSSNGDAIVVHYRAAQVLIENLRLWNACTGLSIGRSEAVVRDVTVRRVLMFGLRYGQAPPGGTAADGERCKGRGIQVTNATHLDLYHLTLDDVPSQAVLLSADAGPVSDVDLWNSIIRLRAQAGATQQWVALAAGMPLDSIDSDYNLLWHPDALATGKHFSYGGIAVDLATWRSYGRDQDRADPLGSHRADPQFVTNPQANDYHTVPGSLARDGALGNTGSPFCGARPDIGVRESCS
jgi:hypothetical protein